MPRAKAKPRVFADIFKRYKHYDTSRGHGNVSSWRVAFEERMGVVEAKAVMGLADPLQTLGLTAMPLTMDDLKSAYRKMSLKAHPDAGGDAETFKKVKAAYSLLAEQI